MVKTLVIGDLHFDNKPFGLLKAQTGTIITLYWDAVRDHGPIHDVIFLGDLMMHRKPYPRVLLALKEVMDTISKNSLVTIIRGNHDSENKSDDGVTALSLFENPNVKVVTQTWYDEKTKRAFIPHYENEERIKEDLAEVPRDYTVFGHFGYCGSLNSAGDNDFSLSLDDFRNPTILGHIHRHNRGETVTLLGTPYSTNFAEYKKENFYGIIENGELETFPIGYGPRHLMVDYDTVEENLDWINDPNYFTLLRINISTVDEDQNSIADLMDKLTAGYVEVKYAPLLDDKYEPSEIQSTNPIVEINDTLIEEYINTSNTNINKAALLTGLTLIHENQQSRNK